MLTMFARPFGLMDTLGFPFGHLRREMDRLLESTPALMPPGRQRSDYEPAINLWQDGENLIAETEIPGFKMSDVEVMVTSNDLTIRGQRSSSPQKSGRIERATTAFERTTALPIEITPDGVKASLLNGVLRVEMPLSETARPRRINISEGEPGPRRDGLPSGGGSER